MTKSEGEEDRDKGMARVLGKNTEWAARVRAHCETALPHGWIGSGEDIRHLCKAAGIGEPTHQNAWGAVINSMVINDAIIFPKYRRLFRIYKGDDGREKWVKPTDRASHARPIKLYIRSDV